MPREFIDDDAWLPPVAPQAAPVVNAPTPVVSPAAASPMPQKGPSWAIPLLLFTNALFATLWLISLLGANVTPGPGPNPDPVDGKWVALFYEGSEKDSYTRDQLDALDSSPIAGYLDDKSTQWLKVDVNQVDDLVNMNPIFRKMSEEHMSKLPWVVCYYGSKKGSEPITDPASLAASLKRWLE